MAFTPFDIWEKFGITEHLGGIPATQRLLQKCQISPGELVLDIGCGTGYSTCQVAEQYRARVIGLDISQRSLVEAKRRVIKDGLVEKVWIVQADAHHLPFRQNTFGRILVESLLIFCRPAQISREIYRVLTPSGIFCANEITLLDSSSNQLIELMRDTMQIRAYSQQGWQRLLRQAGFEQLTSSVHKMRLTDQMTSHLRIDGLKKYLSAVLKGIFDPEIRRVFFNRQMLTAARKFLPFIGYGIYTGKAK
jgi:ubiquinone/menaquinone biosynthesis C-methylase UbiE